MGFLRFRRSVKLFPGVRLNLSKSGVSTSVGRRGLWFTIGPRGTRTTIGIPGTGLSYTETHAASHDAGAQPPVHLSDSPIAPQLSAPPAVDVVPEPAEWKGTDWRGLLIALIIGGLLAVAWMLVH